MPPESSLALGDIPFEKLLEAIRAGDNTARAQVVEQLHPRMVRAIRRRFGSADTRAGSAEDAVQSACRTVFRRLAEGEFLLPNWDALTGLLIRIAWYKTCRMLSRTRGILLPGLDEAGPTTSLPEPRTLGPEPLEGLLRAEMQTQFGLAVEEVYRLLRDDERLVLRGKLDGLTAEQIVQQIAHELEQRRSERWVARHWAAIRVLLQSRLRAYEPEM